MDETLHASQVRIGDCILDRRRGILLRESETVAVRAKTFALLGHLAEHRGRVLSKDELLTAIWPGVIVSEDSLTQCVRDLRKALGDEAQQWVRTVSRRGYMLAASEASTPDIFSSPGARPEPSVAVLPFAVAGEADPVLVDGVIEEVTNGLARFRTVTVIARASAFSFPVADRPPPQVVGERLGADHLVEGSFRRTPAGFRVAVTLTHAPTARQVWGEHFDCSEADLLDIDRVISRRIIGCLVANLEDSVLRRYVAAPPSSLQAFGYLVRGKMHLRAYGDDVNSNAVACLQRAIEIDPDFGLAQSYLALAEIIQADYGAAPRPVIEAASQRARLGISLAPEESRCHRIMGLIQLYRREHGAAESYMRRALELNPYDADALAQMGYIVTMRGRAEEGMRWVERAIELNPYRPAWYDSDIAFAFYALGRYDDAIEAQERIPDSGLFQEARLAASHAMAGRLPKAAIRMRQALDIAGDLDLLDYLERATEYEHAADLEHLLEGMKRALDAARSRS